MGQTRSFKVLIFKVLSEREYLSKWILTCIVVCFSASLVRGQLVPEMGLPNIESLEVFQKKSTGKLWSLQTATNGLLYAAADNGLVEFDGLEPRIFKGSAGITRAVLVVNDSLIYSGADLDFGCWRRTATNLWAYESLYPFVGEPVRQNEEFWGVYALEDKIIFISNFNIYIYKNNQFTKIAAPDKFIFHKQCQGVLFIQDRQQGLHTFDGFSLQPLANLKDIGAISGVYLKDGKPHFVTRDQGLFSLESDNMKPIEQEVSNFLTKNQVFSLTQIGDKYLAFGTILAGLYITDMNGRILQHISKQQGLSNNTILSVHYNSLDGRLWLGTDVDPARVDLASNLSYFPDFKGTYGTPATAVLHKDVFYLGTNQGLFSCPWSQLANPLEDIPFSLVKGSEGQVWSLRVLEDKVYCGHDKGLFVVTPQGLQSIYKGVGVWDIEPYASDFLLAGTYDGIHIFKKEDDDWIFQKKMNDILGSCNTLCLENDSTLWVHIPNFGILRVQLDTKASPLKRDIFKEKEFGSNMLTFLPKNDLFRVATDSLLFVYNTKSNSFDQTQNSDFIVAEGQPLNNKHSFYPLKNGFSLASGTFAIQPRYVTKLLLRQISCLQEGKQAVNINEATLPADCTKFKLQFLVPHVSLVHYQYKTGNGSAWSTWKSDGDILLDNLAAGEHTVFVRAKAPGQDELLTAEYLFNIAKPWYQTGWAYIGYILLTGAFIAGIRYGLKIKKEGEAENQQLSEQHQERLREVKNNHESLLLKNQKLIEEKDLLKQQVRLKTIELAKKAKENEDKNRLLRTLKEKLDDAESRPALSKKRWAEIRNLLESNLQAEESVFQIQIEELHQDFFNTMKQKFPELSANDLRLCAYIKIGLSSKEMAEMIQVRPSSIYVSRSRLRKKLNLETDEDLYGFLNNLG